MSNMKKENLKSEIQETVIEAGYNFFKINWKDVWAYRDLLFLLVRRDFVSRYKQTILGPAWFIFQPLMTTLVFTIVFGKFAKIPTNQIPPILFYLCGLLAWDYFAQCVSGISGSLISHVNLFSKVYFPRLIIPLSIILSNLMKYGLQFTVFLGFFFYFKFFTPASQYIHPNGWLALLPVILFMTALASLGVGLWVCAITVKYRDFQHLISFTMQLWMYGTPVIYPLSSVPEKWKWVVLMNPMTEIVEFYRFIFFGTGTLTFESVAFFMFVTTALFLSGLYMFNRVERTFIDTI